jgi:glycosyltransferase involved in cell wall biosynthesis
MSYVWLDVTTIYQWSRPAVGVVRVELECAAFALKHRPATRFCRFDWGRLMYVEITPEEIQAILIRVSAPHVPKVESLGEQLMRPSLEHRFVTLIKRCLDYFPAKWQPYFFSLALSRKTAFHAALQSYRSARIFMRELLNPAVPRINFLQPNSSADDLQVKEVTFSKEDIYLSLGLDWDQKALNYLYELKQSIGFKVVLFCYDIIPVKLPHLCLTDVADKFVKYFANLAWCADRVLCISECSRKDFETLITDLQVPIPKVDVITLGCDIGLPVESELAPNIADILKTPYVLFVSTIERRKNHEVIYRAYTRLIDAGIKNLPLLVFVGMSGWGVQDLLSDLQKDIRIRPYIRILNSVKDSDLVQLYRHAYFTVYPSLYEGWGLPVSESLSYGKFCLASNTSSLPEAGQGLIEHLDPWDVASWASRIQWYVEHPEALKEKERTILEKYQRITWAMSAASILDLASQTR